jgi:hypothetical protein
MPLMRKDGTILWEAKLDGAARTYAEARKLVTACSILHRLPHCMQGIHNAEGSAGRSKLRSQHHGLPPGDARFRLRPVPR